MNHGTRKACDVVDCLNDAPCAVHPIPAPPATPPPCTACGGKGWVTPSIKMYPGDRVACSRCVPATPSLAATGTVLLAAGQDYQTATIPLVDRQHAFVLGDGDAPMPAGLQFGLDATGTAVWVRRDDAVAAYLFKYTLWEITP